VSAALQTVHVRVNDAATGQPTPVRLRLTNEAGDYFAPFGRVREFATGRNQDVGGNLRLGVKPYAYIDGTCEVALPPGPVAVEIAKGFEYTPIHQEIVLKPGQLSLRFAVERWTDFRRQQWYAGDTRAFFLPPHAALLEGAAEDLAVVNLLAAECPVRDPSGKSHTSIPNILAFSGQAPALERPGHLVMVNTHNAHPVLGSLGLLNCHRAVFPLSFGGPDGWDNWALADWCDQCHRKGGLVVWTRAWHESADFRYGEPLADLILGKIDAFEIDFFEDSPFDVLPDWYALLNCGFRVPLVGASGKDSNGLALGSMRTYARLRPGEGLSYHSWIEAVRAGRTFVTNGPVLTFTVNGQDPGETLPSLPAGQKARVRAEARGIIPFDRLEIVAGGIVVASAEATSSPRVAALEFDLDPPASGWLAARCRGEQQLPHRPAYQRVFAHSSPVYLTAEGQPERAGQETLGRFIKDLDQMLEWVRSRARCETDKQRQHLAGIFTTAREVLRQRLA
jgi:hypothetical protein